MWSLVLVLALASPPAAAKKAGGPMTRDEAVKLVKAAAKLGGIEETPGLNAKGLGGFMLGPAQVYFEYQAKPPSLVCRAHIFTRHKDLDAGLRAILEEEGKDHLGGGRFEYMSENRAMFLTREYAGGVEEAAFVAEVRALAEASMVWRREVLPRASERAHAKK